MASSFLIQHFEMTLLLALGLHVCIFLDLMEGIGGFKWDGILSQVIRAYVCFDLCKQQTGFLLLSLLLLLSIGNLQFWDRKQCTERQWHVWRTYASSVWRKRCNLYNFFVHFIYLFILNILFLCTCTSNRYWLS